jgi:Flp pilus assembly protein TadG
VTTSLGAEEFLTMNWNTTNNSERGVATVEFALTASFFFMMILVVVIGGHLFWLHNSLVEATRRGARYAANQCNPSATTCPNYSTTVERITNVVLYNTPTAGTAPIVPGLTTANVRVTYCCPPSLDPSTTNFGVAAGEVSVQIQGYDYRFVIPGVNIIITLPPYQTTVAGENAGFIPPNK